MAILKAISLENSVKKTREVGSSNTSSSSPTTVTHIYDTTQKLGNEQVSARTIVERVFEKARSLTDFELHELLPENDKINALLDYANCGIQSVNCSLASQDPFRSFDGTCNNLLNPLWGAANTAYRRLLPAQYEDGISLPVGYNQQVKGDSSKGPCKIC